MWLSSERDGLRVGRRGSWGRGTSTECYRDTEERHAEGIGTRDVISDCGMWEACRRQHPSRTVSRGSQRKEGAQGGSSQEQKGLEAVQGEDCKISLKKHLQTASCVCVCVYFCLLLSLSFSHSSPSHFLSSFCLIGPPFWSPPLFFFLISLSTSTPTPIGRISELD